MDLRFDPDERAPDWTAVGHRIEATWLELAGTVGAWLVAGIVIAVVARAYLRRQRYRAVRALSEADVTELEQRVRDAERGTRGQLAIAILERSDAHPQAPALGSLALLAVGTILMVDRAVTDHPAQLVGVQGALALAGWMLAAWLPDVRRMFISESRATEMAEEQACQEFHRLEMGHTRGRTGVLILVSLLEHRVVVLADEEICSLVPPGSLVDVDNDIIEGIKASSLKAGLVAGIERMGNLFAQVAPLGDGDEDDNERPDQVIVRTH